MFETSALFILLQAYAKFSGDLNYAAGYTKLLEGYANWMAEPRSLYPDRQLISVDAIRASANQTLLAVQAAVGLNAAHIITGNSTYSRIAANNVNALYYGGLGLDGTSPADSTHFTYNYGYNQTWNVLFPSYSDVLLGLDTFPQEAWEMQSKWYLTRVKQGGLAWGHHTGGSVKWGLTDWSKFLIRSWRAVLTHRRRCHSLHFVFRSPASCYGHYTCVLDQWEEQNPVWNQIYGGRITNWRLDRKSESSKCGQPFCVISTAAGDLVHRSRELKVSTAAG